MICNKCYKFIGNKGYCKGGKESCKFCKEKKSGNQIVIFKKELHSIKNKNYLAKAGNKGW